MGTKKTCKYYYLILLIVLFACSTEIKRLEEKNLAGKLIRVDVNNSSYEVGITHIFKNVIETDIIKRGGNVTEIGENIKISVDIIEIKSDPISFDKRDVANIYNLTVKANIKIYAVDKDKENILKNFRLTPNYNYEVKGLTDGELKRQLSIEKAAHEISSIIISNLVIMP